MNMKPYLVLMQYNAPFHKAVGTMREIDRLWINHMFWPAFSPDSDPIESLWNTIRVHVAIRCREEERDPSGHGCSLISFQRFSEVSREAWERITPNEMLSLINSIPRRCQAVINADWGYIPNWKCIFDHIRNFYIFCDYRDTNGICWWFVMNILFASIIGVWRCRSRDTQYFTVL